MEIHIIFIETRLVTFTKNTTQVGQYENCGWNCRKKKHS